MLLLQTPVLAHSSFTSRCEQYFKNADKFVPERWLRDSPDYVRSHPFAFLPFGHGGRGCIGRRVAEQQLYLAVIKVIQPFHFMKYVYNIFSRLLEFITLFK